MLNNFRGKISESCFISGYTGSGKSTLLKTFNGLIPDFYGGEFIGRVRVFNARPSPNAAFFILQNPYEQITSIRVLDELIFPAIQSGMSYRDAKKDAMAIAEEMGVGDLLDRFTFELSTGELQIIEILSALISKKKVILLDEPFAHLSRKNAMKMIKLLEDVFCVMSDHRTEFSNFFPERIDLGTRKLKLKRLKSNIDETIFEGSIKIKRGEIVAITGDNGSGKTKLLKRIAVEMRELKLDFGISLQNPNYHLTESSVMKEVLRNDTLEKFGLLNVKNRHPHSLSHGEAKRLSIAKIFRHEVLLLDEPTAGQDQFFREKLLNLLREHEKTAVIATHDENLAKKCDRIVEL